MGARLLSRPSCTDETLHDHIRPVPPERGNRRIRVGAETVGRVRRDPKGAPDPLMLPLRDATRPPRPPADRRDHPGAPMPVPGPETDRETSP
ncbi:hypothetical protein C8E95_3393 [Pseudonocardia autotrophica]|uniref:Uncharacterized protein n=2 Tax=Pseudonocardia TaxID=1847 RepID=A0A1Y2N950_PSEAH|nr:hypothetical protein BG845_00112 [Pseudonocardia autotrophica]TDN74275.1 hypothetical protein C8E95_3393 [Pseudonocardia autotrophica]BBG05039.1 hypothetical protein Pdca_62480 [Pseudonocardia autotrophica]GEC27972.1 hypothetical protein PSA01_50010 [Pseudonocardia saturnea]